MRALQQAIWMFLVLIAVSFASWYAARSKSTYSLDAKILANTTDVQISNLTVRQFDAQGKLTHILQTPKLRHIPHDNMHYLTSPSILVIEQTQPAWKITSKTAIAANGGKKIVFKEAVKIHQDASEKNPSSNLTTEEITYYTNKKFATTDKYIKLDQGDSHLRAASATTQSDSNNKLIEAIAHGNNVKQAHFWTKQPQDKPILHAYANKIIYLPAQNIVKFIGDAKVKQDKNWFSAPTITYNTKNQEILTKSDNTTRTVIAFYPEKHYE